MISKYSIRFFIRATGLLIGFFCLFLLCSCFIEPDFINEEKISDAEIYYVFSSISEQNKIADRNKKTAVDLAISDYISENNIKTAVSVGIYGKDFRDYYYAGFHSFQKINEILCSGNTCHYIYSISKTFVAAEILLLEERGAVSLSDKISDYLPDLIMNYNLENYINMDATIEELLTHKSGICDFTSNPRLFSENPFLYSSSYDPLTLLKYIEHIKQNRGEFIYSSANYVILGKIIESITGKNLQNVYEEDFFSTVNLKKTCLSVSDNFDYDIIAHPHVYPGTQFKLVGDTLYPIDLCTVFLDFNYIKLIGLCSWAAGGIISNAEDLSKWGYKLFSENGESNFADVRKKLFDSVKNFEFGSENSFGYGCRKIFLDENNWLIGHYGRSFGSENLMFYSPELDLCITIMLSENKSLRKIPDVDEFLKCIIAAIK